MSKGYITISRFDVTVWRVLIWLVMIVNFIVVSIVIIPLWVITIGNISGSFTSNAYANKINIFIVNSLARRHVKLMPWFNDGGYHE